jgi:hypothetical protein
MFMKAAGLSLATTIALGFAAPSASAQANVPWVSFTKQPSMLALTPLSVSDNNTQVLFRTGDLDKDGWDDVVAVRKAQAGQIGKRAAILLMNDQGVLRDETALYASASDLPGDSGFLTPCNNFSAAIGDVDGDTWPDVVTSVALSDGFAKSISHPRVYMNLGDDINGNWLGLRYEDGRFPQLLTVGGMAVAPRFCALSLGDVTGDGFADIFFNDFDTTETNINEPSAWDLNDRLLVNDGNGFFSDESAARFTTTQLNTAFGRGVEILDLNNDTHNDIVKISFLTNPLVVRALYNDPTNVGNFKVTGTQDFGPSAPHGMDLGNLNNDAFTDVVIADDGLDKFRFGAGFNGLNKMIWGPMKNFTFVTGADDGFAFNTYIRDLDGNGWNDVLISAVDADLTGCNRRMHIYHNTGSVPGDMSLVLKEESEFQNGGTGAGWKGVVGMTALDQKGTYDVGFGDFDKDGDLDLLVGTCSGTEFFRNETKPWTDLGFALPGVAGDPLLVGEGPLTEGSSGTLLLRHAAPSALSILFISSSSTPVPFKCGTLLPFPWMTTLSLTTDGTGGISLAWPAWPGGLSGTALYWQYGVQDAAAACGVSLSNALRADVP